MRDFKILSIAVAAIFIAVTLPIAGALQLAKRAGTAEKQEQVTQLAEELLRHFEAATAQAFAAVPVLTDPELGQPCSPASIEAMRSLELSSSYLKAVGYVENHRLRCSGSGIYDDAPLLADPGFVSSRGLRIRRDVSLPGAGGRRFIVGENAATGFAAIFYGDMGVDLLAHVPDIASGMVSRSTGRVVVHTGFLSADWLAPRGTGDRYTLESNGYLVAFIESQRFDFGVYAAVPTPPASALLAHTAAVFVPVGIIVAAVLVYLVILITRAQFSMSTALQQALGRKEIFMVYQPVVDLQTREWIGAEALIRWVRDDGSHVRPDVFIPMAEESDLIQQVTKRVCALVSKDIARFSRVRGARPFYVAINVSPFDMQSEVTVGLVRDMVDTAAESGMDVVIEATERGLMDREKSRAIIDAIRACGAAIALDDFGTGYSSLSYIRAFKLDYLKIDRAFVETIGTDSPTSGVVHHIIEIAKTMNLEVVAEGVETEAQAAYLLEHGVRYAQGWLFSETMSATELAEKL